MANANRRTRFTGRAALRSITNDRRCKHCGYESVLPGGHVGLRKTDDGVVGYAGLATCGKIWLCPVCNAKVMAKRAMEIGAVLLWADQNDLKVIWGSLTSRHSIADKLDHLIGLQTHAWRTIVSQRWWKDENATKRVPHECQANYATCNNVCNFDHLHAADAGCEYQCIKQFDTEWPDAAEGRVGYIRAAELTVGANGWHPHFHPIIFYNGTTEEAEWHAADIVGEWVEAVRSLGGEAQADGSQQLKVLEGIAVFEALTGYVTKATYEAGFDFAKNGKAKTMALEPVWSQGKDGNFKTKKKGRTGRVKGTVSHWSLLVGIAQGLADEVDRWHELEDATRGHRMITWSRGIRAFAGVGVEKDDEAIAAEEVGSKEDTVCIITATGWETVRETPDVMAMILDVLEEHGWDAVATLLDHFGIDYATAENLADTTDTMHEDYAEAQRRDEFEKTVFRDIDELSDIYVNYV